MAVLSNSPLLGAPSAPNPATVGRQALAWLQREGLFSRGDGDGLPTWRVSAAPFALNATDVQFLERLGPILLAFYQSLNRLYYHSLKDPGLSWVAGYLDQGKPPALVEHGRMRRLRHHLPGIIRPDLLMTDSGWIASELDAVPGGFGLTAAFHELYGPNHRLVGGNDGVLNGFSRLIGEGERAAVVVSDESADYRPEMQYLARALSARGGQVATVSPAQVVFEESGLSLMLPEGPWRIDVVYRFFELFDLKNVPKSELVLYAAKKETARMVPPAKAFLEEKLAMALWHHPALRRWWSDDLGARTVQTLTTLFPRTWILDPAAVPAHAAIAGFEFGGNLIRDWRTLDAATQRERRYVIKPSGFSPLAWGGRGVVVGHDQPAEGWRKALRAALEAFPETPHILQEFHAARRDQVCYIDEPTGEVRSMAGRTRLSPYYFVAGDQAVLGGVLATTCSLDKKVLHGMRDAVLAPCTMTSTDATDRVETTPIAGSDD